jgi:hypothetical protein
VLLLTFGKTVTKATLLAAYDAAEHFIAAEGSCGGIVDFAAVENAEISAEDVRSIAERPAAFPAGMPRVFVAPRPVVYGMSRMYQIIRDDLASDLHVVHTLEEANALLGLESPDFKTIEVNDPAPRAGKI